MTAAGDGTMKIFTFSARGYDEQFLSAAAAGTGIEFVFCEASLSAATARMAAGCDAVCCFVNDDVSESVLAEFAATGIRLILLRCAGFNNVNLKAASRFGLTVMRVPEYSPHAVAEHTLALLLSLNRRIHRAWSRVRESDFRLEGLLGFDLHGKTIGVVGTGRIGTCMARILLGLGCQVLATDRVPNQKLIDAGVEYVDLETLLRQSRVITLHCPLTLETRHMINRHTIAMTLPGVILINTSRGALVDTNALIHGLKNGHVGGVALDVYEEEAGLFFEDHSLKAIPDDVFARLLTFPNVLITGHQAFFTEEALRSIAETTVQNALSVRNGSALAQNLVSA